MILPSKSCSTLQVGLLLALKIILKINKRFPGSYFFFTLTLLLFDWFKSGAGKTSLMNVLSFRNIRALSISGDIKINGRFVNRDQMNDISAYLQQEDLFLGTMTVREHLLFKVQCFIKASFFGGFCTNLSTCFRTLLWIFFV